MTRRTLLGRAMAGVGSPWLITACDSPEGKTSTHARARSSFRIAAVRVHPVEMRRVYRTRVDDSEPSGKSASLYLLVELISGDGTRGVGELSDVEPAWNAPEVGEFQRFLSDQLVGADASDRHRLSETVAEAIPRQWHVELRRMLWAAVDMALLDLAGNVMGVPAYELLGGRHRMHVPVSWVAFVRHASVDAKEIEARVAQGFRAFKLKVGSDLAADGENVATIRKIAGPEAYVKVDPSGTWNEEQAIENIRKLTEVGVDAVETPVEAASREIAKNRPQLVNENPDEAAMALARVRRAVPAKIIEHVGDFEDQFSVALVRHKAVDIFNIIPSQTGSLSRARRLAEIAEAAGVQVLLGSTVELGPGTAAALHLGVSSKAVTVASDLIGPGHLEDDVVTPVFTYDAGRLRVPDGPGFGVTLDAGKLEKYRPPRI